MTNLRLGAGNPETLRHTAGVEQADHSDAWNVAHFKADLSKSNLALAYIELREIARRIGTGEATNADRERMISIIHSNDL